MTSVNSVNNNTCMGLVIPHKHFALFHVRFRKMQFLHTGEIPQGTTLVILRAYVFFRLSVTHKVFGAKFYLQNEALRAKLFQPKRKYAHYK